jgi:hypothetical protein
VRTRRKSTPQSVRSSTITPVPELPLVTAGASVGLELELPHLGRATSLERAFVLPLALRVLSLEIRIRGDLEHPEIPGILDLIGRNELLRLHPRVVRGADGEGGRLSDRGRVAGETRADDGGESAQDLVLRVRRRRGQAELIVVPVERLEADEVDHVDLASPAGLAARDDQVDLSQRPVSHPVDEADLRPEVVGVAGKGVAVEEDAERVGPDRVARLLPGGRSRRTRRCEGDAEEAGREGEPRLDHASSSRGVVRRKATGARRSAGSASCPDLLRNS